ncbi:Uncharacterised protein [Klebsiella pneumoniae]|uniref:Uncharacterized protein n=1 Tax=Klebsiella pneumoniae TaxID=573 RepID=A0A2L1KT59_KLEPN|nr:hypothetical protein A7321_26310 [Klebsiella pneumoniae]AVE25689.1 hypothetical protein INF167p1_00115 [Klebsiella pneumoniae]SAQ23016.1 Uncharacterised protein [Klebsiella pneumoniae]SLW27304.1 Uncharacterised protein [Klebsiella pneumoniae]SLW33493.1 Uncharacterised protein [Klebsiella pneumoniae]
MATVLVSAPANGLKRVIRRQGKGAGTRRNDEERGRETALPCRVPAVLRRHGESGAAGTVAASAAVDLDLDLRHQTLAVRPETACGFGGARQVRQQLPWRSVARRLDSAAGREPKVSNVGVLLKPLRVKKRHHSRKRKRKQTDSSEQTGNVKMQTGENMFSCRRKEAMINRRHTRRGVRNGAYFPS